MQSKFTSADSPMPSPSEISAPSEAPTFPLAIGSSRAVSHARIFPSLVKALGWQVNDPGSGSSMPELLASYDPDSQSWKTSELSLFGGSIAYSGALPRSGTMRNGKIYAHPTWGRPTDGKESGLWPTPVARDDGKTPEAHLAMKARMKGGERKTITSLTVMVKATERGMWPTPKASDGERGGRGDLIAIVRGKPNSHSGLWPTPNARDYFPAHTPEYVAAKKAQGHGMSMLNDAVKLWPTPRTKGMCGGTGNWNQLKDKYADIDEARKMGAGNGGQLNPMWVEWLMGYPLGWTDLNASGIALSLRLRN